MGYFAAAGEPCADYDRAVCEHCTIQFDQFLILEAVMRAWLGALPQLCGIAEKGPSIRPTDRSLEQAGPRCFVRGYRRSEGSRKLIVGTKGIIP
jgi:hypothetical protein